MNIKLKLTLGVGLLFVMITLLTVLSVIHINKLSGDTKNILADNYLSIDYSRQMLNALNQGISSSERQTEFRRNLEKQQTNNTEIGEAELTQMVTSDIEALFQNPNDGILLSKLRHDILEIMYVNMQAIQRKSEVAKLTAESATIMLSIVGTICFLLAFILLVNLPSNIANPIRELTESVKAIAAKNYSQRVHLSGHNEFGALADSFNTMARKLEEYNNSNIAKLMMEKERIDTLINNMRDAVIGLDENQKILFINNEALKISGLKLENVIGKSAQQIAIYNDLVRSLIQDVLDPHFNNYTSREPLKIYADNKESFFDKEIIPITIVPVAENQSKHIGDVIILQNITPFKELDFAKTNFIATVSHELKTPIASIMMSLELLRNKNIGSINSEQDQLIQSVKEDSERLLKITGELLDMTQVESGKIHLNLQHTSIKMIVQYAMEAVRTHAIQKNISINTQFPDVIPDVNADPEKTAWVITNLLTNAIHYSYDNTNVLLIVSEQNGHMIIRVQDHGMGIDNKYLPHLFDRYFQIPGSSKTGTGLGLAICREFIEAQGGTITLQSEIGKGSIFTVSLIKSQT
ncbi:MAG TPA: ATP-binding protein [Saprospiraceae bacterium]|jgi:NtrC-family two-component system sensor histidine kinase KinB|nr:ATP-binding protein [Saprospiraceae bacterium]HRO72378.1 ATP-binding protein [Saprospiraceae bacterium]HRP42879.1 ATP-binding protein [Saprospiraceae bacterium]